MNRKLYPTDWKEISHRIRFERAKGKCEWCGVPHRSYILRSTTHPERYVVQQEDGSYLTADGRELHLDQLPMEFDNSGLTYVRLTTHHIGVQKPDGTPGSPHDKMDCRDENLAALCERCHFIADMKLNIAARRKTRNRKKRLRQEAAGQKELW